MKQIFLQEILKIQLLSNNSMKHLVFSEKYKIHL